MGIRHDRTAFKQSDVQTFTPKLYFSGRCSRGHRWKICLSSGYGRRSGMGRPVRVWVRAVLQERVLDNDETMTRKDKGSIHIECPDVDAMVRRRCRGKGCRSMGMWEYGKGVWDSGHDLQAAAANVEADAFLSGCGLGWLPPCVVSVAFCDEHRVLMFPISNVQFLTSNF